MSEYHADHVELTIQPDTILQQPTNQLTNQSTSQCVLPLCHRHEHAYLVIVTATTIRCSFLHKHTGGHSLTHSPPASQSARALLVYGHVCHNRKRQSHFSITSWTSCRICCLGFTLFFIFICRAGPDD